jgi:hypothetical protein
MVILEIDMGYELMVYTQFSPRTKWSHLLLA